MTGAERPVMNGECHFCHGLVLTDESEDMVLEDHADHTVFLHRQCAVGHNVIEQRVGQSNGTAVLCPICDEVESL